MLVHRSEMCIFTPSADSVPTSEKHLDINYVLLIIQYMPFVMFTGIVCIDECLFDCFGDIPFNIITLFLFIWPNTYVIII